MIIRQNDKPLCAISYETSTYANLKKLISSRNSCDILYRIHPEEFIKNPSTEFQYVNLVVLDYTEREKISFILDEKELGRFTFIDDSFGNAQDSNNVHAGPGCVLMSGIFSYGATLGKDCIVHGRVSFAEDVSIGNGCFLSGLVTVAGSTKIGNFCFISTNVTIMDHLTINDHVRLLPGMVVRKSITDPGTYYNPYVFEVKKMKDAI